MADTRIERLLDSVIAHARQAERFNTLAGVTEAQAWGARGSHHGDKLALRAEDYRRARVNAENTAARRRAQLLRELS